MTARLLVTGGRKYTGVVHVAGVLGHMRGHARSMGRELHVLHGACGMDAAAYDPALHWTMKGCDRLADDWCVANGVPVDRYPAHWAAHGKAAGPMRNEVMVRTRPDWVIAFPGDVGTAHCATLAVHAGLVVGAVGRGTRSHLREGELVWWAASQPAVGWRV